MEEQKRDIFEEALILLKKARLKKYGYAAKGFRAVRIEETEEKSTYERTNHDCIRSTRGPASAAP